MMTTMVVVVMVAATMTAALRRMMVRLMEPPIPGEAMRVPALRVADRKPGTAARNQRPQHRRRLVGMTVLPVEMMAPVVTRPAAARIQAEGSGLPIGELLPAMTDQPPFQFPFNGPIPNDLNIINGRPQVPLPAPDGTTDGVAAALNNATDTGP